MTDNKTAALRDQKLIKSITEGLDLNNPDDVEKIYKDLQSGVYSFESQVGRDFDDKIYELMQNIKSKKIEIALDNTKGKKNKKKLIKEKAVKKDTVHSEKNDKKESSSDIKNQNDIQLNKPIDDLVKKELKRIENRRKLILILASLVAALSLGYFIFYYYNSSKSSSDYEELAALKGSDTLAKRADDITEDEMFSVHKQSVKLPDLLDDYKTLFAKNQKMIGWLKIDGTKIDYPVMQTDDNEYYLSHNFNNQSDNNGALFLDYNCMAYPRSTNMIIYGHHMKSGNMFGNLQKYAKESYYKEHKKITFDTIYEYGTYEVMYVFYSKVYDNDDLVFKYYQFIEANSEAEFNYYMDEMKKLSLYDTGVSAKYGDTLLTLSTCDHSQTDGRFAVVAKRIK